MRCPYCGHHELKVVDSRDSEVGEAIRRRRECFDPQKLFGGLRKATEKRDISPERLNAIVADIEAELRRSARVEIPSGEIGEMAMLRLRELDEVAYIRFASVYREFKELAEVKKEIEEVLEQRVGARAAPRRG